MRFALLTQLYNFSYLEKYTALAVARVAARPHPCERPVLAIYSCNVRGLFAAPPHRRIRSIAASLTYALLYMGAAGKSSDCAGGSCVLPVLAGTLGGPTLGDKPTRIVSASPAFHAPRTAPSA